MSYVKTSNDKGLGVISNSVREFEIIDGENKYDTIAITIFRSFGHQGKRDLLRRPGRASGTSQPTPDSQLIGNNRYELALTSEIENISEIAKDFTSPVVYYSTDPAEDLLLNKAKVKAPGKFSLFSANDCGVVLSAVKKCQTQDALMLRFYNTTSKEQELKIDSKLKVICELMLDDSVKNKSTNGSKIKFKPFEIKTLLLK